MPGASATWGAGGTGARNEQRGCICASLAHALSSRALNTDPDPTHATAIARRPTFWRPASLAGGTVGPVAAGGEASDIRQGGPERRRDRPRALPSQRCVSRRRRGARAPPFSLSPFPQAGLEVRKKTRLFLLLLSLLHLHPAHAGQQVGVQHVQGFPGRTGRRRVLPGGSAALAATAATTLCHVIAPNRPRPLQAGRHDGRARGARPARHKGLQVRQAGGQGGRAAAGRGEVL